MLLIIKKIKILLALINIIYIVFFAVVKTHTLFAILNKRYKL